MADWVSQYRGLEQAGDAIMELIAERNRITGAGGEGLKVSKNREESTVFSR